MASKADTGRWQARRRADTQAFNATVAVCQAGMWRQRSNPRDCAAAAETSTAPVKSQNPGSRSPSKLRQIKQSPKQNPRICQPVLLGHSKSDSAFKRVQGFRISHRSSPRIHYTCWLARVRHSRPCALRRCEAAAPRQRTFPRVIKPTRHG
jgi:hypothetical protein